ncbi:cytochrome C biogenesis protein CycK [Wolbachia pipientis]|uniref:Cytochrome C biogenesis protein CycK n=1 Tax=Wolbachia pipientis TaxID=955 RepID=A0A1E7QLD8_WOLPI|nr:heme lyase CcmF/NrfE family subunit [Wolbachia pipientis]OEY87156.1 cytochrome C biogenesis protein CycK [Wolbachia pipientis]
MPNLANILLVIASLLSFAYPFFSYRLRLPFLIFLSVFTSMAILVYCHITNDFSIENVYYNSHSTKPLLYKISGVWGNKEGSMLLWTLVLTLYLFLMDIIIDDNNLLKRVAVTVQALICLCFVLFTLLKSNPFIKMPYIVSDGLGFNPILQDIGLAIHPPILYLGYLGFSATFSLAIAGLIKQTEGNIWAKIVRPWVLISWSLLTLGISLGSWWAYRELGWGGFWFWDPVENISLMPWLIGIALIHLLLIVRNFNVLKNFAVLLTLITFSLGITGTFLVRSGILSSVHAFTNDQMYGFYLLVLLSMITGSALLVFIFYKRKSSVNITFPIFSRFTIILINNLLFITAFFVIFSGTLYPILLKYLTGELISVGTPYYNILFNPIVLIILIFTIIGQYCRWQGNSLLPIFSEYRFSFCSAAAILPFILHMQLMIILSIVISVGLLIFILEAYSKRIRLFKSSLSESITLAQRVSKTYYAMMIAHAGVALLVLGIACSIGWQEEKEAYLKIGDSITVNKFKATLQNVELVKEKNFHAVKATISIQNLLNNKILGNVMPEYRFYLIEGQRNIESSIYHNLFSDIYVIVGEFNKRAIATKVYYKPAMSVIWIGSIFIALGSLLAML